MMLALKVAWFFFLIAFVALQGFLLLAPEDLIANQTWHVVKHEPFATYPAADSGYLNAFGKKVSSCRDISFVIFALMSLLFVVFEGNIFFLLFSLVPLFAVAREKAADGLFGKASQSLQKVFFVMLLLSILTIGCFAIGYLMQERTWIEIFSGVIVLVILLFVAGEELHEYKRRVKRRKRKKAKT